MLNTHSTLGPVDNRSYGFGNFPTLHDLELQLYLQKTRRTHRREPRKPMRIPFDPARLLSRLFTIVGRPARA